MKEIICANWLFSATWEDACDQANIFCFSLQKGAQILSNIVKYLLLHPPPPHHHHSRKQAEDPEQEVDVEALLPANLDENLNRLFLKDKYPNIVVFSKIQRQGTILITNTTIYAKNQHHHHHQ